MVAHKEVARPSIDPASYQLQGTRAISSPLMRLSSRLSQLHITQLRSFVTLSHLLLGVPQRLHLMFKGEIVPCPRQTNSYSFKFPFPTQRRTSVRFDSVNVLALDLNRTNKGIVQDIVLSQAIVNSAYRKNPSLTLLFVVPQPSRNSTLFVILFKLIYAVSVGSVLPVDQTQLFQFSKVCLNITI